jgi:hypothetical protein
MSSVPRAAFLGGILALFLHLLIRLLFRNLHWIAVATGMIYVLDRCAPDYQEVAAARAIRDSFDSSKVKLTGVVGVPEADGYVSEIAVTVMNAERARVFDLKAICSYRVRGEPEPYWTTTDYHYGYIGPGTAARIRLRLPQGVFLGQADPNSFACKPPSFEVEKSDLFRTGG